MKSYSLNSILFLTLLLSCSNPSKYLKISAWGSDVSATKNVLETGLYNGEKYDYVISSFPIIFSSMKNNSNLKLYENITDRFSVKYNVNGFPQAGLFINAELEKDTSKEDKVKSFISHFDLHLDKLLSKDNSFTDIMNKYSTNLVEQTYFFGFNSSILNNMLDGNKMAFISNKNNPSIEEFGKVSSILDFTFTQEKLSKYYLDSFNVNDNDFYSFSISAPVGAPAASLLSLVYTNNDELNNNLSFTTPINIRSSIISGNKDFVIFDSTTGMNLSDKYKLVRMITYGNLHLISTGNDENNQLDYDDKIFGYGEELIPGKVSKKVYEKE